MDWDQRAFAWIYRTLRRTADMAGAPDDELLLDLVRARLETLSGLLAGRKWQVATSVGLGGAAEGRLLVPAELKWLTESGDRVSFYIYRVVFGVSATGLGFGGQPAWSERQRGLAMLLSVPTVERYISERYPGATSLLAECKERWRTDFPFATAAVTRRCLANQSFSDSARRLLGEDGSALRGAPEVALVSHDLVAAAAQAQTPASLAEAVEHFDKALSGLARRGAGEHYQSPWGTFLQPEAAWAIAPEAPSDPRRNLPSGTERKMRRRSAEIEYVDLESQKNRDNPLVHSFEKVHTAAEYQSGKKQLDGSDELAQQEEALDELNLKKLTRTSETAHSVYRADLDGALTGADASQDEHTTRAHRYHEWNFKGANYRDAWCTVKEETSLPSAPATVVASASRRLRGQVLRLQGELKRLAFERRWRNRQLDGSEIDIDALVDRQATLLAGQHPDPRVYARRKQHDSDLAVLLLVDASLSSDSWVSGQRIFDVVRDSTQVLLESFERASTQVSVAAFYSNTRRDCRFLLAKPFADRASTGLHRLHAVAPAGYTRIGPAIRHATKVLEDSGARKRLIVLLTDAKPTDYDRYEGRYGVEDVRQAVREAAEQRTHCLTLAVRDTPEAHLTQMFGPQGWLLLPNVQALPARFIKAATPLLRR